MYTLDKNTFVQAHKKARKQVTRYKDGDDQVLAHVVLCETRPGRLSTLCAPEDMPCCLRLQFTLICVFDLSCHGGSSIKLSMHEVFGVCPKVQALASVV